MPDAICPRLTGVIAPFFTPWDEMGRLDEEGIRSLIRWLKGHGVDTVFFRSGMGKMYTFTLEETKRIASIALDQAAGEIGVIVGAGGIWDGHPANRPERSRYVAESIDLACAFQEMEADGAVLVMPLALTPCPGEPMEEMLFGYFQQVSSAVRLPLVIYQPPGLPQDYRMTPELLKRLLSLPNIAGMKLSTGDLEDFTRLAGVVRSTAFALITGNESLYLEGLRLGSVGVIGQGCCLYPEILQALRERFRAGDEEGARRAQEAVWEALKAFEGLDAAVAGKQYLIRKGVQMLPHDRSGTFPFPKEVIDRLEAILDRCVMLYRREG